MGGGLLQWGWSWGGDLMIVFWIILIAFMAYWFFRSTPKDDKDSASAIETLKKRYAKGKNQKNNLSERKKIFYDL